MPLDDNVDNILNETNAAAEAVKHLIHIEGNTKGEPSKVEVKTDLTNDEVRLHSVLAILHDAIMSDKKTFNTECILGDLIERKERKLISKERKSRMETVEIARQPDMPIVSGQDTAGQGIIRRMFTPKPRM